MFVWRNAIVIGVLFVVAGFVYLVLQGSGEWLDRAGVTLLISLGIAMGAAFTILLRGSRDL